MDAEKFAKMFPALVAHYPVVRSRCVMVGYRTSVCL